MLGLYRPRIWELKHKERTAVDKAASRERRFARKEARRQASKAEKQAKQVSTRRLSGRAPQTSSTIVKAQREAAALVAPPKLARAKPKFSTVARETQLQFKAFKGREEAKASTALVDAFNAKIAGQKAAAAASRAQRKLSTFSPSDRGAREVGVTRVSSAVAQPMAVRGRVTAAGLGFRVPRKDRGKAGLALIGDAEEIKKAQVKEPAKRRTAIFRPSDERRGLQSLGTKILSDKDIAKALVAGRITGQQLRDTGRVLSAPKLVLSPAESQRFGKETREAKEIENLTVEVARASSSLQEIAAERGTQPFLKKTFTTEPLEVIKARTVLNRQIGKNLLRLEELGAADRKDVIKFLVDTEQFKLAAKFPSSETRSTVEAFKARRADDTALSILGPIIPAGAIIKSGFGAVGGPKFLALTGAKLAPIKTFIPKLKVPTLVRQPFSKLKFRSTKPKLTDEALDILEAQAARGTREVVEEVLQKSRARPVVQEAEAILRATRGKPTQPKISKQRAKQIKAEEAARPTSVAANEARLAALAKGESPFLSAFKKSGDVLKTGSRGAGRGTSAVIRSPFGRVSLLVGGGTAAVVAGGTILSLLGPKITPPQQAPAPAAPAASPQTTRQLRQQPRVAAQAALAAPTPAPIVKPTPTPRPTTPVREPFIDPGETPITTPTRPTTAPISPTITVPVIGDDGQPVLDPTTGEVVTTEVAILDIPKEETESSIIPKLAPIAAVAAAGLTALLGRGKGATTSSTSFGGGSVSFTGPTIFRIGKGKTGLQIIKDGKGTITLQVNRTPVRRYTILGRSLTRRPRIGFTRTRSKSPVG